MGKNIFAKIADLINGTHSDGDSIPKNDNKSSNSIDKKGDLLNAVISTLKSNYAGTKISLKDIQSSHVSKVRNIQYQNFIKTM